jgi:hypothetical protein
MKIASFALAAAFAIAHGSASSASAIRLSDLRRAGTCLEPLNIAGCATGDPANEYGCESEKSQSNENKLDKGKGVIKPSQDVDPGIVQAAPAPDPNTTPVIKPPGTPGGAPGPEPK